MFKTRKKLKEQIKEQASRIGHLHKEMTVLKFSYEGQISGWRYKYNQLKDKEDHFSNCAMAMQKKLDDKNEEMQEKLHEYEEILKLVKIIQRREDKEQDRPRRGNETI